MTAVNETEYYESMSIMRDTESIQSKLWDTRDIYRKINEGELNDETSDDFLIKCYVDTVIDTGGIINLAFSCVRDGVFRKPQDYSSVEDYFGSDYDYMMMADEYDDEYRELRMMDKKTDNENAFKNSLVDALLEMDKARMKVAECLLARANKTEYMELFYVYSGGAHHELGSGSIVTKLYRCLRHIHSGAIKFDYKFGEMKRNSQKFDAMFCSSNTLEDYAFFVSERDSFNEPVVEFDPAITNHDKSKYATVKGFVCATTGEVIAMR